MVLDQMLNNYIKWKLTIQKNKKQLQKLLGLINWFRPYIKNLSIKLSSITKKLEEKVKFEWYEKDSNIIKAILSEIKQETLLKYPDLNKNFVIETDASDIAMGAVLFQENKIVGLYSSKYGKSEKNYTSMEKETLAIIKAVNHFKPIIFNAKIIIKTDNSNLIFLGDLTNRIQRWKLQLEEYDYSLEYKKGKENVLADTLSRLNLINENGLNKIKTPVQIQENQLKQTSIQITKNEDIDNLLNCNNFQIKSEIDSLKFLKYMHEKLKHPGEKQMINTLKKSFKIKKFYSLVKNIVQSCNLCNLCKNRRSNYGKVVGGLIAKEPLEFISTDIFGPIKTNHFNTSREQEYFYILTVTDIFSRWTEVEIIFDITSLTITEGIKKIWLNKFQHPKRILSDQGRQYISKNFNEMLKEYEIKHYFSTAHNPNGNSISERINQTIAEVCRLSASESFEKLKQNICIRLNYNNNRTTGYSPYEIIFKRSPFTMKKLCDENFTKKIYKKINNEIENNAIKRNKKRISYVFKKGELIFRKNFSPDKCEVKWKGPFEIIEIDRQGNNVLVKEKFKITKQNVKNIRPFLGEGGCRNEQS